MTVTESLREVLSWLRDGETLWACRWERPSDDEAPWPVPYPCPEPCEWRGLIDPPRPIAGDVRLIARLLREAAEALRWGR